MKVLSSWFFTVLIHLTFAIILIGMHPFHVTASLFGYKAYMIISHLMMFLVWKSSYLIGNKTHIEGEEWIHQLPADRPIIVLSNHQSEFEIGCLGYLFSKTPHHLKYLAKKELAYWIPSVSWNIRYGGHGIINRYHRKIAFKAIENFAKEVDKHNWAAYIYPEGTRNKRSNEVKPFKSAGFLKLCESLPDAIIIPIALENFWTVKAVPVQPFSLMRIKIFEPIEQSNFESAQDLLKYCEELIRNELHNKPL